MGDRIALSAVSATDKGDNLIRFTATLIAAACVIVGHGTAAAAPLLSSASAGPVFSGNGVKSLPLFKVEVASTLRWTNSDARFQILPRNAVGGGLVDSTARSGATYLRAGTYRLEVNAIGNWRIRIVAGVERPQSLSGGLVGFRGNGSRELPPFSTGRGTNLIWSNSGAIFQIYSSDYSLTVYSQARRGKSYMAAGRHQLRVNAIGNWTIGWKP